MDDNIVFNVLEKGVGSENIHIKHCYHRYYQLMIHQEFHKNEDLSSIWQRYKMPGRDFSRELSVPMDLSKDLLSGESGHDYFGVTYDKLKKINPEEQNLKKIFKDVKENLHLESVSLSEGPLSEKRGIIPDDFAVMNISLTGQLKEIVTLTDLKRKGDLMSDDRNRLGSNYLNIDNKLCEMDLRRPDWFKDRGVISGISSNGFLSKEGGLVGWLDLSILGGFGWFMFNNVVVFLVLGMTLRYFYNFSRLVYAVSNDDFYGNYQEAWDVWDSTYKMKKLYFLDLNLDLRGVEEKEKEQKIYDELRHLVLYELTGYEEKWALMSHHGYGLVGYLEKFFLF